MCFSLWMWKNNFVHVVERIKKIRVCDFCYVVHVFRAYDVSRLYHIFTTSSRHDHESVQVFHCFFLDIGITKKKSFIIINIPSSYLNRYVEQLLAWAVYMWQKKRQLRSRHDHESAQVPHCLFLDIGMSN